MRRSAVIACLTVVSVLGLVRPSQGADLPGWLAEAAKRSSPTLDADADAVVLLDEAHVTVQTDGRILTRRRYAVRVLNKDGAEAAALREVYEKTGSEIRVLRGWQFVDGRVEELGKRDAADLALVDNDVYNEARIRVLRAKPPTAAGMVFGAEVEKLDASVFAQLEWWLQDSWPAYRVRRSLTLPRGWDAQSVTLNHAPIQPSIEGSTRTWAIDDLPALPDEVSGPPASSLVPRVAVTYFGATRGDAAFDSWPMVSRWLATLQDPQARATPALADKARQLTGSAPTPLAKIRAIAAYAQAVQYISIQTGIGRGGGYKPHAAAEVLQKNYGDCKDKANLMRALLATLDIPSYLVGIYAGDASYVKEEWPSPQQFNHAIIAIPVSRETQLPAVAHGESGSVLFFDPTDEHIPLGELPLTLQGSLGLIVSATEGRLVRMPVTAPESHAHARTIRATIADDGALTATIRTLSSGEPASLERALFKRATKDQYLRLLEADVRSQVPGARLTLGTVGDDRDGNRFELTLGLESRAFAQGLQTGLVLVGAPSLGRLLPKLPEGSTRTTPVVLDPVEEVDRFELTIPANLVIDELPAPVAVTAPFGRFEMKWTAEGTKITRTLTLRVLSATVPAGDYGTVRRFIEQFRDAEGLPVVLVRRR
jgi:hypothetical protein